MDDALNREVVVAVGDDESLAAADVAAAEAMLHRLPLVLIAVPQPRREPKSPGSHPPLGSVVRRLCTTWPGLAVAARVVRGAPADALIEASRTAAVVVITRHHNADGNPSDSQCARVAAYAHCPTLVVSSTAPVPADRPVLLGLDLSIHDEPAIAFAFHEAALRRVPLVAAHVWSGIPDAALGAVSPFAYDLVQARATADRLLAESLAGWAEKYPEVPVERKPLYDVEPARALSDASSQAGLLVVGASRHRASSLLLGRVTRTLLRDAACPLGIVPRPHDSQHARPDGARTARPRRGPHPGTVGILGGEADVDEYAVTGDRRRR